MRDYKLTTLYVDYTHLLQKDDVLADAIQRQYYRFLPYLKRALQNLVARHCPEYLKVNPTAADTDSVNLQSREFNVAFYHLPLVSAIRDLRTDRIGRLMSISGTVTRTSEVRPELLFGSFICEVCGGLVNEIEQQFKYTEVSRPYYYRCIVSHCRIPCSPVFVQTLRAEIESHGSSRSTARSLQTGKKSVFKKIPMKSRPVPCPAPWTSSSVPRWSSAPKPETNASSRAPSLLFPMSVNSVCQEGTRRS